MTGDYLKENYFADVVIFDPNNVIDDNATFEEPLQYAEGSRTMFL